MANIIDKFDGEHEFLSNFFIHTIIEDGIEFPTNEHAFQAAKTNDRQEKLKIAQARTPGVAKRAGRKVTLRPDWEEVKIGIMTELVWLKFQDPGLKQRLLATGDAELVEGNNWNDRFWGVCEGTGRNELGKILMQIRAEIAQS